MGGIINTGFEDKQTNEFVERFADKTIEQLISLFNEEQPKKGWVSARGRFLSAPPSAPVGWQTVAYEKTHC
jgi:hypothetical protein